MLVKNIIISFFKHFISFLLIFSLSLGGFSSEFLAPHSRFSKGLPASGLNSSNADIKPSSNTFSLFEEEADFIKPENVIQNGWRPLRYSVSLLRENSDAFDSVEKEMDFSKFLDDAEFVKISSDLYKNIDIEPARLDTYIYNQNPYIEQALVELVANAQDATNPEKKIGRFGVGVYQMFQELKSDDDSIEIITSTDGISGIKLVFKRINGELSYKCFNITENIEKGTSIIVNTKLTQEGVKKRRGYLSEKLSANARGNIKVGGNVINNVKNFQYINGHELQVPDVEDVNLEISESGYRVVDKGIGMSADVLFKNFLLPKSTTKPLDKTTSSTQVITEETKVFYAQYKDSLISSKVPAGAKGIVSFQVSGVKNVTVPVYGINVPYEMVIELPHDVWLPESRDKISLDDTTYNGILAIVKKLTDTDRTDIVNRYALLNSLSALLYKVIEDSPEKGQELLIQLKKRMNILIQKESEKGTVFLPNRQEFEKLAQPVDGQYVFLNELLFDFNPKNIPGSEEIKIHSQSGNQLFAVDFGSQESQDLDILIDGLFSYSSSKRWILIDKSTYEEHKKDPMILNQLLNFEPGHGGKGRNLGIITKLSEKSESIIKLEQEKTKQPNKQNDVNFGNLLFDNDVLKLLESFNGDEYNILKLKLNETFTSDALKNEDYELIKKKIISLLLTLADLKSEINGNNFQFDGLIADLFTNFFSIIRTRPESMLTVEMINGQLYAFDRHPSASKDDVDIYEIGANGKSVKIAEKVKSTIVGDQLIIHDYKKDEKYSKIYKRENGENKLLSDKVLAVFASNFYETNDLVTIIDNGQNLEINIYRSDKEPEIFSLSESESEMFKSAGIKTFSNCSLTNGTLFFLGFNIFNNTKKLLAFDTKSKKLSDLEKALDHLKIQLGINYQYLSFPNGNFAVLEKHMASYTTSQNIFDRKNNLIVFDSKGNQINKHKEMIAGKDLVMKGNEIFFIDGKYLYKVLESGKFKKVIKLPALREEIKEIMISDDGKDIVLDIHRNVGSSIDIISGDEKEMYSEVSYVLNKNSWQKINITANTKKVFAGGYLYMTDNLNPVISQYDKKKDVTNILGSYELSTFYKGEFYWVTTEKNEEGLEVVEINKFDKYSGDKVLLKSFVSPEFLDVVMNDKEEIIFYGPSMESPFLEISSFSLKDHLSSTVNIASEALDEFFNNLFYKSVENQNYFSSSHSLKTQMSIPILLENRDLLKDNISLLKDKPISGMILNSLTTKERSRLLISLASKKDWSLAYAFIKNQTLSLSGLSDEIDELFEMSNNIRKIRYIFAFIEKAIKEINNSEISDVFIKRWITILKHNSDLAYTIANKLSDEKFDTIIPRKRESLTVIEGLSYENPDFSQLPSDIKLYLDFLTSKEIKAPISISSEKIAHQKLIGDIESKDLSWLIKLRSIKQKEISKSEKEGKGYGDIPWHVIEDGIVEIARQKRERLEFESINNDIVGAVNGQDKTNLFFIRELVQNARDAIRGKKDIDVKSGFLGHGFYTVFAGECDEVRLTTGNGSKSFEIIFKPKYDAQGNLMSIPIARFRNFESSYQGTRVERVKHYKDSTDIEATLGILYATTQSKRFLSAINSKGVNGEALQKEDVVSVLLNDEVINEDGYLQTDQERQIKIINGMSKEPNINGDYEWIVSIEDPVGMDASILLNKVLPPDVSGKPKQAPLSNEYVGAKIESKFSTENINRVTVDDLFVDSIDHKYSQYIPKSILNSLLKRGWNIAFPQGTRVSRTRNGVLDPLGLNPWVTVLALKTFIKIFMEEEGVEIPGLPSDYLYNETKTLKVSSVVERDAGFINRNQPFKVNFKKYLDDPLLLAQLLTKMELDHLDSEVNSLSKLKTKIMKDSKKMDDIESVKNMLPAGMKHLSFGVASHFKGKKQEKRLDINPIENEMVIKTFKQFIETLGKYLNLKNESYVYAKSDADNIARASCNSGLGWNIAYHESNLQPFLKFLKGDLDGDVMDFFETFFHETAHTVEDVYQKEYLSYLDDSSERVNWTHTPDQDIPGAFGWVMKKLIMIFLSNTKKEDLGSAVNKIRNDFLSSIDVSANELSESLEKVIHYVDNYDFDDFETNIDRMKDYKPAQKLERAVKRCEDSINSGETDDILLSGDKLIFTLEKKNVAKNNIFLVSFLKSFFKSIVVEKAGKAVRTKSTQIISFFHRILNQMKFSEFSMKDQLPKKENKEIMHST